VIAPSITLGNVDPDRDREQGGARPVHRALRSVAERAKAGDAPEVSPRISRRAALDETSAARKPVLV